MKYYGKKGTVLELAERNLKFLDNGGTSNIYRIDDETLLKRYYTYASSEVRINEELFECLRTLNSKHIVTIHELLKDELGIDIIGYLMQYIKAEYIDYLDSDKDLFLTHIEEIERVVDELTKLKIRVMDLKHTNVITQEKGLTIIDPDKYRVVEYEPFYANKDQVLYLAYSLLNFGKSKLDSELDRLKLLTIRKQVIFDENTNITSELSKVLSKSRKPIDILRRAE